MQEPARAGTKRKRRDQRRSWPRRELSEPVLHSAGEVGDPLWDAAVNADPATVPLVASSCPTSWRRTSPAVAATARARLFETTTRSALREVRARVHDQLQYPLEVRLAPTERAITAVASSPRARRSSSSWRPCKRVYEAGVVDRDCRPVGQHHHGLLVTLVEVHAPFLVGQVEIAEDDIPNPIGTPRNVFIGGCWAGIRTSEGGPSRRAGAAVRAGGSAHRAPVPRSSGPIRRRCSSSIPTNRNRRAPPSSSRCRPLRSGLRCSSRAVCNLLVQNRLEVELRDEGPANVEKLAQVRFAERLPPGGAMSPPGSGTSQASVSVRHPTVHATVVRTEGRREVPGGDDPGRVRRLEHDEPRTADPVLIGYGDGDEDAPPRSTAPAPCSTWPCHRRLRLESLAALLLHADVEQLTGRCVRLRRSSTPAKRHGERRGREGRAARRRGGFDAQPMAMRAQTRSGRRSSACRRTRIGSIVVGSEGLGAANRHFSERLSG